jgi:lipopolysaccharide/colanic/teichoic acid biosynthesis glycosyltransferase
MPEDHTDTPDDAVSSAEGDGAREPERRTVRHYVRDRETGEFLRDEVTGEYVREDAAADVGRHEAVDRETVGLPLMTRLNVRGFRLLMVLDVTVLFAVMLATMLYRFGTDWPSGPAGAYTHTSYYLSFAVLLGLHFAMFYFGGLYEREPRLGGPPVLPRAFTLSFGAILIFALLAFVLGGAGVRPLPAPSINLAVLVVLGSVGVTVNRALARANRRRLEGPPRVLLVGAPDEVNVASMHLGHDGDRVRVVGEASSVDGLVEVVDDLDVTDVVLLSGRWLDDVYPEVLRDFEARDIGVLQRVTATETLYGLERVREVGGMPFVPLREHTMPMARVRFKRFLELTYLVVGAPVWVPVLALLALHQLIVAGRPILYWQTRVGRDGELYEMVKFRTMRPEAEAETGPRLAAEDDPRVIPACGWLRATRLDELPQIFHVIRGEMSIVGPRPERPELTAKFEELIPGYATRYEIPPGITGLAQVHGRYHTDPEYKLGYDLQYLVNWSPLLDLEIVLRTVWVIVTRRI